MTDTPALKKKRPAKHAGSVVFPNVRVAVAKATRSPTPRAAKKKPAPGDIPGLVPLGLGIYPGRDFVESPLKPETVQKRKHALAALRECFPQSTGLARAEPETLEKVLADADYFVPLRKSTEGRIPDWALVVAHNAREQPSLYLRTPSVVGRGGTPQRHEAMYAVGTFITKCVADGDVGIDMSTRRRAAKLKLVKCFSCELKKFEWEFWTKGGPCAVCQQIRRAR